MVDSGVDEFEEISVEDVPINQPEERPCKRYELLRFLLCGGSIKHEVEGEEINIHNFERLDDSSFNYLAKQYARSHAAKHAQVDLHIAYYNRPKWRPYKDDL